MRCRTMAISVLLLGMVAQAGNRISYVVPKSQLIPVYSSEIQSTNPEVRFNVGVNDRLQVVGTTKDALQISDSHGRTGWVLAKDVTPVISTSQLTFDTTIVHEYIDNPDITIIFGEDQPSDMPFMLSRSLKDFLMENTDRETVERIAVGRF